MQSKLRVWWIPQVGADVPPFHIPVSSVEEAKKVMDILGAYDQFQYENNVKPDFANACGLEAFDEETGEWNDWCYETETAYYDDVDEYCEEVSPSAKELEAFANEVYSQVHFSSDEE